MACAPVNRLGPARQDPGWTAYLGTARHDVSAAEQLNPDPRPLWKSDVGRAVRGSPALGETVIAVGLAERVVMLLDRASGQPVWRHRVDGTIHGGPLLDGDRLYVATERTPDGYVYALRLRDGRRMWRYRAGSVAAPLAVETDAVYAATEGGAVHRIEPESGRLRWKATLPGAVRAAPVPTAHGLLVTTTSDSMYLLDGATGAIRRRAGTPGAVLSAPALDGDRLFLATATGTVLLVSLPDLRIQWTLSAGDGVLGSPALAHDTLYVMARNGRLWIIPADAPGSARAHALDVVSVAGPTPTASGVLVASVSGEVLLVDPRSGAVLWRAQVDGPVEQPPLVLDRQLVVVGGRGDIHAYR